MSFSWICKTLFVALLSFLVKELITNAPLGTLDPGEEPLEKVVHNICPNSSRKNIGKFMEKYFREIHPGLKLGNQKPLDSEFAQQIIQNIEKIDEEGTHLATLNLFHPPVEIIFKYFRKGQKAVLKLNHPDCLHDFCTGTIETQIVANLFEGTFKIQLKDKVYIAPVERGVVHGLVMEFGLKPRLSRPNKDPFYHTKKNEEIWGRELKYFGLSSLIHFENGWPSRERAWFTQFKRPLFNPAFVYGEINPSGQIEDENGAYIYSQAISALVGEFEENQMISCRLTKVTGIHCKNNILRIEFDQPKNDRHTYEFSSASPTSPGKFIIPLKMASEV